jgi:hypothetical protein
MNETNRRNTGPQGRDFPLQFASAKLIMKLTGGHCPCHPDKDPSFSAKPGREPGTTIVACGAGCSQADLLDHFRKLGYRLGPMKGLGRPAPVNAYGYDLFRGFDPNGEPVRGGRTIKAAEVEIVREIFARYAAGEAQRKIACDLNARRIPAPRGGAWSASTLNGNRSRGTGILTRIRRMTE